MGKHARIAAQVAGWGGRGSPDHHPCYVEYFRLFNSQAYYEAHDVLEHIWIGSRGGNYDYYKALIQFAGAFVHLQLQHNHPGHRVHGKRLRPAARLFLRSAELLAPFPPDHQGVSVSDIRTMAARHAESLAAGGYEVNPWSPEIAPRLAPPL